MSSVHGLSALALGAMLLAGSLAGAADIRVLTWNVNNLYDTRDDPDTADETWLPMRHKQRDYAAHWSRCERQSAVIYMRECMNLDWSERALREKISRLAAIINAAPLADIIALQEVENRRVLNRLADALNGDYPTRVLLPGRDSRGINVALISTLALEGEPAWHPAGARGILQVNLEGGIHILVVHFASPFSKPDKRIFAWRRLQQVAEPLPGSVIALGDFNITQSEDEKIWQPRRLYSDGWQRAAQFCRNCTGTYYYARGKNWSMLDRIFLKKGGALKFCEARVIRSGQARPEAFRLGKNGKYTGASDHWPLFAKFCGAG